MYLTNLVNKEARYSTLASGEDINIKSRPRSAREYVTAAIFLLSLLVTSFISYRAGLSSSIQPTSHAVDFQTYDHVFRYNRSFSERPNNHTNRAWDEMFPPKGGFFVSPDIAPKRATFHVFHALHCLNYIRQSYWMNHEAAAKGQIINDTQLDIDYQPTHVRHCIDLIRNTLMCSPDTTLEIVDEEIRGVHGFHTLHRCVNWEDIRNWVSRQQLKYPTAQII